MRQGELHHVGERALLQLVAVQGQELLELTAHVAVLKGGEEEDSVDLFRFLSTDLYSYCKMFLQGPRNKSSL